MFSPGFAILFVEVFPALFAGNTFLVGFARLLFGRIIRIGIAIFIVNVVANVIVGVIFHVIGVAIILVKTPAGQVCIRILTVIIGVIGVDLLAFGDIASSFIRKGILRFCRITGKIV